MTDVIGLWNQILDFNDVDTSGNGCHFVDVFTNIYHLDVIPTRCGKIPRIIVSLKKEMNQMIKDMREADKPTFEEIRKMNLKLVQYSYRPREDTVGVSDRVGDV